MPFAVGIPLLPVFGWLGAAGSLPPVHGPLVPWPSLAGAALAIGNAGADLERDRAAGTASVATALGGASWCARASGLAVAILAVAARAGAAIAVAAASRAGAPSAIAAIVAGVIGRRRAVAWRRRG